MRTGKRPLARVISSRELPALFVLTRRYALGVLRGVNAKMWSKADTGRAWELVAPARPLYISRMTRTRDNRSSDEDASRRREHVRRDTNMLPPRQRPLMPKPKERPASKGRVHMGKTRN
jgi:hypothetical protein